MPPGPNPVNRLDESPRVRYLVPLRKDTCQMSAAPDSKRLPSIREALTFDDVLLVPRRSSVIRERVDVCT